MKYLVTGCSLLNDMKYADGSVYTVCGVRPYEDEVLYVTVAGPDFGEIFGKYLCANGLSSAGMDPLLPKTLYYVVEYKPSGEWGEYCKYGEDFYERWEPVSLITGEHVARCADAETKGIYFESRAAEKVWDELGPVRAKAPNVKIMWELSTSDMNDPSCHQKVREVLERVDAYSLNLPESMSFFGTDSEQASIDAIIALGKPCFFRVGEKGSYMIEDGKAYFAPSVGVEGSVDATGCGNCSTGTAMYGYCEGFRPLKTAVLANLAAALNAKQYGPYPQFTAELRAELNARAETILKELEG